MNINLDTLSAGEVYFSMIQTLVPRPIAWVLSEHSNGSFNLAPFSYFTAVSSAPPLLMISVGKKPDGSNKDTRINIEQRGHFVVHIPSLGQLDAMNASAMTLPADASEVDELKLETTVFDGFSLPRLKQAKIAYGCECYQIQAVGDTPQSLILGRIRQLYIDDSIVQLDDKERIKVDATALDPVARLGASEYMGCGPILTRRRPG